MSKNFHLIKNGFTLIEILVVIAIIAFFSTFLIVGFRGNEKQRAINNAALSVVDGLKRMQTMAFSGSLVDSLTPVSYNFLIGNCSSNCSYILRGQLVGSMFTEIEEVNFDKNILVDAGGSLEIKFASPRGAAMINENPLQEEATIKLSHKDSSLSPICVKVNRISGRMDIVKDPVNCP
ncbi:MAG: type II secretion system protein [Patescibacteria group bacterium]